MMHEVDIPVGLRSFGCRQRKSETTGAEHQWSDFGESPFKIHNFVTVSRDFILLSISRNGH